MAFHCCLLASLSVCRLVGNAFQVFVDLGVFDPKDGFFFFGILPFFRIFLVFWQVSKILIFMDLGVLDPRDHFWFFGTFQFIFDFWHVSNSREITVLSIFSTEYVNLVS